MGNIFNKIEFVSESKRETQFICLLNELNRGFENPQP